VSDLEVPRLSRRALLFLWGESDVELRLVGLLAGGEARASTDLDQTLGFAHGRAGRLCGALARLGIAECVRPGHYRLARDGTELLALRAQLSGSTGRRLDRIATARLHRLLRAELLPASPPTQDPGTPSAERMRQGDGFETWQGRDPEGWMATAPRAIDTLARMVKSGEVPGEDARAARRFQGAFHRAQLDPLKALDLAKIPAKGSGAAPIGERIEDARDQVWRALTALGGTNSPAARALWYVIGGGLSIDEWARRERWGNGRPLHHTVARGIVIGALAAHRAHVEAGARGDAR
jgi:hypothetical protein